MLEIMVHIKDLGLPEGTSRSDIEAAYGEAANNLMNEIEGYQTFTHSNGTNFIFIDAKWKGKQISTNIEKIRNNKPVENYQIIHNSLDELQDAVYNHDIFKAYSLGCTLFESYGIKILKKYFDKKNVHITNEKMDRINLQTVIIMLYTNNIINQSEYTDMDKIRKIRNDLIIHKDISEDKLDLPTLELTTSYIDKILMHARKLRAIISPVTSVKVNLGKKFNK